MPSQAAFISPAVLRWARVRARLSIEALASKAHVKKEKIAAWESGSERPTMRHAEHVAATLYIPFGFLFLPEPPVEGVPLPDFRRPRGSSEANAPSPELIDIINDVIVKQQWYREFLLDEGQRPFGYVGSFKVTDSPITIAADIRKILGLTAKIQEECTTWSDFSRALVKLCESAGVLVLKSGIVGGNPHRKLSVDEFRGFTISDPIAPFVFINGSDTRAAQIFTLCHELAHVWINASGISDERMDQPVLRKESRIEWLCDQVAAEALVPANQFTWESDRDIETNLAVLSKRFRVSSLVILRRALDLGLIRKDAFIEAYRLRETQYKFQEEQQSGGGNFFPTLLSRNSNTFTRAVVGAVGERKALFREAAQLLNVKVPTINKVAQYIESA